MRTWLKEARQARKKTQTELAVLCGICQQSYSFIEHGTRTPRPVTAKKIASILGFDWTLFFENEGDVL